MAHKNAAQSETRGGQPDAGQTNEKKRPGWRSGLDGVLMLGGAVLVALVIKAYAFDVYLIPSGSMETALHGRPDGGDRIFCPKINYRFRGPERWEVAVFDFPYENSRRNDIYGISEQYKGQKFVKRIVGLPGDSLAIYRGDIWVRNSATGQSAYERLVKPDSVQRGMWLHVYREDFSDIALQEFESFWKIIGGDAELRRGGRLILSAEKETVRMDYRPLIPAGSQRGQMVELPGIPDRYTLEQPVQFACSQKLGDGSVCGHVFVKTVSSHNIQGRCPKCGTMLDETAVAFYHRRSGLAGVGRYAVNPKYAPQGEDTSPRQSEYHIVPDLRIVANATLDKDATSLGLTVREDSRFIQAAIRGDGRIEFLINGEPSLPENRAVTGSLYGKEHRFEFYMIEGTARLYVDGAGEPILESVIWKDRRAMPRNIPKSSGAGLVAAGGKVTIGDLSIDRDVFYYSGWEFERGEKMPQMSPQGEVFIDEDSFFPMGDHCTSSFDARSWGPVPLSLLRGPAKLIWWPPDRIGIIPSP